MSSHVGTKLKLIRKKLGQSQSSFCDLLDIGLSGYKKYEVGATEPGYSVIEKLANHPETKIYIQWLLTGETNPAAGQYSPSDQIIKSTSLSDEEFEEQFVDVAVKSLLMFCHLDWFRPNKDKGVDFDDCGKLLLKDLKPVIAAKYANKADIKSA